MSKAFLVLAAAVAVGLTAMAHVVAARVRNQDVIGEVAIVHALRNTPAQRMMVSFDEDEVPPVIMPVRTAQR